MDDDAASYLDAVSDVYATKVKKLFVVDYVKPVKPFDAEAWK